MNPVAPFLGVIVLSVALTVNFFRAAWKLGILRAFGRRRHLRWRTWIAGALAACLPFSGAMAAVLAIPAADTTNTIPISPLDLTWHLAAAGFVVHLVNDKLMHWGSRHHQSTQSD
ncbi:MAG: hypothetical protein KGI91_00165 [Burkholderiales bacterium]|nr:hypothetical protein [Burkholderiales bacterium]MDE2075472.1 hypothetical protein [Burkholderiales bacterium]MDE2432610.1 hypothetical protein [Burkholderiales bacterium]